MLTIFVTLDRDELIDEEFLFGDKELTAKEKAEYRYEHILAVVLADCIVRVIIGKGALLYSSLSLNLGLILFDIPHFCYSFVWCMSDFVVFLQIQKGSL